MKKLIFMLIVSYVGQIAMSQVIVTTGSNVVSRSGANLVFNNINLQNNGFIQQSAGDGIVKFTGAQNNFIYGNNIAKFDRFVIAKQPGSILSLASDVRIEQETVFTSGMLNLADNKLDLGGTGRLANESELSRAYTAGTGYIEAVRDLGIPTVADPANLGIQVTSPYNLGSTVIRRKHNAQTVYNSNPSILRYYDIIPTNNTSLKAMIHFQYFNAELNGLPETTLSEWKSNFNGTWDLGGADKRDTGSNYVEVSHIGKLMRYTLSTAIPPSITCPANISVNAGSSCTAQVSFTGTNAAVATGVPTPVVAYRIGSTPITSSYTFPLGTTTVTAVASDGVNADATCSFNVRVYETTPPVITSCPPSNTLCYNSAGTYSLTSLIAIDNCSTVSVTYNISGVTTRSGVGTNASGVFNVGTSYINWLVSDASGNTTTCTTSITVVTKGKCTVVSPAARIIQPAQSIMVSPLTLNVLPNPSSNIFKVYCNGSSNKNIQVKVVDILGRLVEKKENIVGNSYFEIGKSYLPGTYILEAIQGNEKATIKLVKQ